MTLADKAVALLEQGLACVRVTVEKAEGSTPREEGAEMLVTARGFHGSIGGGTLEWQAMAEAQAMLGKGKALRRLTKSLGPDLGQCCGGRVTLRLESFEMADIRQLRAEVHDDERGHLHLWGGGHVGRALVLALAPLPFKVTWWDVRENAFPSLSPENVTTRLGGPHDMVEPGLVMVMTHSHALDFDIVDYALRQPVNFPQVGVIGSETKAARFRKRLSVAGLAPDRLTCPIGSKSITSKLPAAIAATVVVQLLEWQEMLKTNRIPAQERGRSAKA